MFGLGCCHHPSLLFKLCLQPLPFPCNIRSIAHAKCGKPAGSAANAPLPFCEAGIVVGGSGWNEGTGVGWVQAYIGIMHGHDQTKGLGASMPLMT